MDIVERLKAAEGEVDGDARKAIHEAWHALLWMREGVALSRRAVEVAEAGKVVDLLDLLRECAPHVFSAAEAEHLLDGFRPQRRPLDDLADRVRDALGPNVAIEARP